MLELPQRTVVLPPIPRGETPGVSYELFLQVDPGYSNVEYSTTGGVSLELNLDMFA